MVKRISPVAWLAIECGNRRQSLRSTLAVPPPRRLVIDTTGVDYGSRYRTCLSSTGILETPALLLLYGHLLFLVCVSIHRSGTRYNYWLHIVD